MSHAVFNVNPKSQTLILEPQTPQPKPQALTLALHDGLDACKCPRPLLPPGLQRKSSASLRRSFRQVNIFTPQTLNPKLAPNPMPGPMPIPVTPARSDWMLGNAMIRPHALQFPNPRIQVWESVFEDLTHVGSRND